MRRILLAAVLALGAHSLLHAAPDPARFQLTPALLQKFKAAEADYKKKNPNKDDDEDLGDDLSLEAIAQSVERDPAMKAALSRQGLSGMDYALTAHAMLHAAAHLMAEGVDKQKAAATYASYTPQQKANIDLLRKTAKVER